jgi:hypothetical protein
METTHGFLQDGIYTAKPSLHYLSIVDVNIGSEERPDG